MAGWRLQTMVELFSSRKIFLLLWCSMLKIYIFCSPVINDQLHTKNLRIKHLTDAFRKGSSIRAVLRLADPSKGPTCICSPFSSDPNPSIPVETKGYWMSVCLVPMGIVRYWKSFHSHQRDRLFPAPISRWVLPCSCYSAPLSNIPRMTFSWNDNVRK